MNYFLNNKLNKLMDKSSDGLQISNGNSSSTSLDTHRANTDGTDPGDLPSAGSGTHPVPSTASRDLTVPGSMGSRRKSTSGLARGVKRKLESCENETHMRKRQKKYRYTHTTLPRGEKRKFISDHSEQPRKRFKVTPPEAEINHHEVETEALVSNSTSDDGSIGLSNIVGSAACSDITESEEISYPQPVAGCSKDIPEEESRDAQNEQADDDYTCPESCVCNVGHSKLPPPIERYFDTAVPLYKCLLMRRLYSLSNRQYTCCERRCVKRYSRKRVMRIGLFHMTEDYDQSDLRVTRYSWGEWKE